MELLWVYIHITASEDNISVDVVGQAFSISAQELEASDLREFKSRPVHELQVIQSYIVRLGLKAKQTFQVSTRVILCKGVCFFQMCM